jgi:hypothetical protein
MNPRELAEKFPLQMMVRQVADGKAPLPRNPEERAIYKAQLAASSRKRNRRELVKAPTSIRL